MLRRGILTLLSSTAFVGHVASLDPRAYENYADGKVRGVNLGGWGVLEPWITPSIFENLDQSLGIVDEYTLCQKLSIAEATAILYGHWSTFYSLADFQAVAATGINTVRIPVGYWSFLLAPGDPYIQGFEQYLDQAIIWAQQTGLKVWIDLHGVPGSQNGFDNSGRRGAINWGTGQTINYSQQALKIIVNKYSAAPYAGTVVAIEIVNEPNGDYLSQSLIKNFYTYGISIIRSENNNMLFVMQDAFLPLDTWASVPSSSDIGNGVIDTHHYEVFGTDFNLWNQISDVCSFGSDIASVQYTIDVVVGEFSGAQTDCTKYLNGYGNGARYDGTFDYSGYYGSCASTNENSEISTWTSTQKASTRRFLEAQLDAYDQGVGWIFWTAKTESSSYWDYLRLIDAGIFPQPFSARQYPGQCGY